MLTVTSNFCTFKLESVYFPTRGKIVSRSILPDIVQSI